MRENKDAVFIMDHILYCILSMLSIMIRYVTLLAMRALEEPVISTPRA